MCTPVSFSENQSFTVDLNSTSILHVVFLNTILTSNNNGVYYNSLQHTIDQWFYDWSSILLSND